MADFSISELLRKHQQAPEPQASPTFWIVVLGLIVGALLLGPEPRGLLLGMGFGVLVAALRLGLQLLHKGPKLGPRRFPLHLS